MIREFGIQVPQLKNESLKDSKCVSEKQCKKTFWVRITVPTRTHSVCLVIIHQVVLNCFCQLVGFPQIVSHSSGQNIRKHQKRAVISKSAFSATERRGDSILLWVVLPFSFLHSFLQQFGGDLFLLIILIYLLLFLGHVV